MRIIKYSEVRENLRRELDIVVNNSEATCVISKNNQVVMISKSDYDTMIETINVSNQLKRQA